MMYKFKEFIKEYRLPIISGLLTGTSYIPLIPWAILFCYIPLWLYAFKNSNQLKKIFIAGWITQFILTLIGFHWIAYTAHAYGNFPWILSVLTLFAFCALAHLYIPISLTIAFWIIKKLSLSKTKSLVILVSVTYLIDYFWPGIFPWHLGYTLLWIKAPIYQWADVIGFSGLSWLIYAIQSLILYFLFLQKKQDYIHEFSQEPNLFQIILQNWKALGAILILILFLNISGYYHAQPWTNAQSTISVLQVQANIGNLEKVFAEKGKGFRDEIVDKFIHLSEDELKNDNSSELIIWPESAIPEYLNESYSFIKNRLRINGFLQKNQKSLMTGAYSKDSNNPDPDRSVFNALFLLDSNGTSPAKPYHKTYLLAFGEYLPFSDTFPFLLKLLPFISNFGKGTGPYVMIWPRIPSKNEFVRIGGQICYEGLFPEFSVGLAKKGAEILVNVTNDSWFGVPFEPYQHLYMTLARAIETRRPLIRSTNTGISTFIDAYGNVGAQSPWLKEWSGTQKVPFNPSPELTWHTRGGYYFWAAILILNLLPTLIIGIYEKFRKS